jgi:cell shape-determining protein MreC
MKDRDKTREQLIHELVELRQRIAELKELEAKRKQAEEELRETRDYLAFSPWRRLTSPPTLSLLQGHHSR